MFAKCIPALLLYVTFLLSAKITPKRGIIDMAGYTWENRSIAKGVIMDVDFYVLTEWLTV